MAFKYHPPTRNVCAVCEELGKNKQFPVIKNNGKASYASSFPIHNWYYFVLGYTPEFPDYIIKRESISEEDTILDPFMGAGTTLVCCKLKGIPSAGIDANDYFVDASEAKINLGIDTNLLRAERDNLLSEIYKRFESIAFETTEDKQLRLISGKSMMPVSKYDRENRPPMLSDRYISTRPFVKAHIIKESIREQTKSQPVKELFNLAIAATLIPISNIKYGPGFGVTVPRFDADVLSIFRAKIDRMIADLDNIPRDIRNTVSQVRLGDSRELSKYYAENTFNYIITSPPYPGDHEYTKHTRLELIFMEYAYDLHSIRRIKERMLRGSTTNIYKSDSDGKYVDAFSSVSKITKEIERRLKEDGATSGFEKLYTKLVREYFGGMYRVLSEALAVLKNNGKFILLVSDSHAFKMVHISTASILAEIGLKAGYRDYTIELWQDKISTSHKYHMRENILTLLK